MATLMCHTSDRRDFALVFPDQALTLMMTAAQLRAARALLGIDQKTLADMAGVSLPTIQRMESSEGTVRGIVDTLTKVIEALNAAGVDLIGENATSEGGGRGVRLRRSAPKPD